MKKEYTQRQQQKDRKMVNYVNRHQINVFDYDANIEHKKIFLTKGMLYENLRVGGNSSKYTFFPIGECSNRRITSAVRNLYLGAKGRIKKQKDIKASQLEIQLQ